MSALWLTIANLLASLFRAQGIKISEQIICQVDTNEHALIYLNIQNQIK
jgi:hypothetical protein